MVGDDELTAWSLILGSPIRIVTQGNISMHEQQAVKKLTGTVKDIFAHRFVIKTSKGNVLVDLGPKGAKDVSLKEGDEVVLSGERKPSELKVGRISKNGGASIEIEHNKKQRNLDHEAKVDPVIATRAAREAGFIIVGEPRRRPKHFELLGRMAGKKFFELQIELDGKMRKSKAVEKDDRKWADVIATAGR